MGSQRKVVITNKEELDLLNATRTVFNNLGNAATKRRVAEFPNDVEDIEEVVDAELDDEMNYGDEVHSKPRYSTASNQTLSSMFARLQAAKRVRKTKPKVTLVRNLRPRISSRVSRPAVRPRVSRKPKLGYVEEQIDDEDFLEDEMFNEEGSSASAMDDSVDTYDYNLPARGTRTNKRGAQTVRVVYVDRQIGGGRRRRALPGTNVVQYNQYRDSHVSIADRVSFVNDNASFSDYRVGGIRGGRIRKKQNRQAFSFDDEPLKSWATLELSRVADGGDRFEPWLKCHCTETGKHKHKGRGFTSTGRLRAFD